MGVKDCLEPAHQNLNDWWEALRTFGSMNALKIKEGKKDLYGVFVNKISERPTDFDPEDLALVSNAALNLAINEDFPIILYEPFTKCYQISWNIIDSWVKKKCSDQEPKPVPISSAEHVALKYIEIRHIVAADPSEAQEPMVHCDKMKDNQDDNLVWG